MIHLFSCQDWMTSPASDLWGDSMINFRHLMHSKNPKSSNRPGRSFDPGPTGFKVTRKFFGDLVLLKGDDAESVKHVVLRFHSEFVCWRTLLAERVLNATKSLVVYPSGVRPSCQIGVSQCLRLVYRGAASAFCGIVASLRLAWVDSWACVVARLAEV